MRIWYFEVYFEFLGWALGVLFLSFENCSVFVRVVYPEMVLSIASSIS